MTDLGTRVSFSGSGAESTLLPACMWNKLGPVHIEERVEWLLSGPHPGTECTRLELMLQLRGP